MITVKVKRIDGNAKLPNKANKGDAGLDFYTIEHVIIKPGERKMIRTGIKMQIPEGYVGLIKPRSGLAVKNGIDVLAGVIDAPYRGEIMICLLNTDKEHSKTFLIGDKIAQMTIQVVPDIEMVEVDELDESDRGEKGFGSSG